MRPLFFVWLVCLIALGLVDRVAIAQSPTADKTTQAKFDACALLQKKEIETLQGSPVKEAKSSERVDGDFRVSQCFYTAAEFSRSITLTVFQKHPTEPNRRSPTEFWKHTFGRYAEKKEGEDKEKEAKESREEEEGAPPRKIEHLGNDAYWVPNRFGGTLYVLKGEAIISISLGGADSEQVKMDKSKKLATKALRRF
jgi:hypothetical protein